jgi:hypothetical protein
MTSGLLGNRLPVGSRDARAGSGSQRPLFLATARLYQALPESNPALLHFPSPCLASHLLPYDLSSAPDALGVSQCGRLTGPLETRGYKCPFITSGPLLEASMGAHRFQYV